MPSAARSPTQNPKRSRISIYLVVTVVDRRQEEAGEGFQGSFTPAL